MKLLAFLTMILTGPDGNEIYFIVERPVECVKTSLHFRMMFEAEGYQVDSFCDYTSAPVTSIRPEVRP